MNTSFDAFAKATCAETLLRSALATTLLHLFTSMNNMNNTSAVIVILLFSKSHVERLLAFVDGVVPSAVAVVVKKAILGQRNVFQKPVVSPLVPFIYHICAYTNTLTVGGIAGVCVEVVLVCFGVLFGGQGGCFRGKGAPQLV